ncbi:MAG: hypothetical protein KDC99_18420 [Cyclobacteriaceae bacterium]|nr:hypothetical protein [Cyclobacteriaceae bacterium]
MLTALALICAFHVLIIIKVVPYDVTWGGRLQSDREMYIFEAVSLSVNGLLIWVLLMKGNYVRQVLPTKVLHAILWFFFGLFLLNTLGNLVAETLFEKFFALVTLLFSFLLWKIIRATN